VKAGDRLGDQGTFGHLVEYVVCSSNDEGRLSSFEIRVLVLGLVMNKAWLFNAQLFIVQKIWILTTEYICVFCSILTIYIDHFPWRR
jgi:hypothetical protein